MKALSSKASPKLWHPKNGAVIASIKTLTGIKLKAVVGASLSEPHTSGTALRRCVCIRPCGHIQYILNERIQIFHKDCSRSRAQTVWQSMLSWLLPCPSAVSVTVTRREVKARVATYFWFVLLPTINGRPLTGGTNNYHDGQWLKSLQVEPVMHGMNDTQTPETVKLMNSSLSPCMCSYIGCPSWRNGWHMWYLATWCITSPIEWHTDILYQLVQARPTMFYIF